MPSLVQNSVTSGLGGASVSQNYTIGGMIRTGQSSSPTLSGKFQIAASGSPLNMYRTPTGLSKVRAPISHIPSVVPPPLHDASKKLTAAGRPQSTHSPSMTQSHFQNSGTGTPRPHFPSQQVT